ncbi:MAG: dTDP-glucose 4,6-dehydratase [Patescibacteria group bacterium]
MKLFITGGAGFIGSNFIRYILANYPDYEIVNFDKLTYCGNLENLKDVENNPRHKFVRGDIVDRAAIDAAIASADAVINFAAETHIDRSILEPEAFLKTNVFGVYNLLEAVRTHNIGRMIQISTDEVYGHVEEGESDEGAPYLPRSPYAASKAAADHLAHAYFVTYGTPVIITHSCNVYGPYQYPEKLIPLFATNLLEGKKIPVYGDGMQIREWIFTADICRALDAVLHRGQIGEVYNIGTGHRAPNIDITKKILTLLEKDEFSIVYVKDRPGHDRRYALNHQKISRELGWEPQISFDDGLRETVFWYKKNEDWWKKIKSGEYLEYYKRQYG